MSAAIDLQRMVGDYFNLAQKYFTETVDLVEHGDTIAQSPDALEPVWLGWALNPGPAPQMARLPDCGE